MEEQTIQQIPLDQLLPDPENRTYGGFDQKKLAELAESIKAKGVLEPILVRAAPRAVADEPVMYDIAAGERRWRAAQIADLPTIPCIVREMTDAELLEIRMIENVQREDVHPLDEAEGYARLIATGAFDVKSLAARLGKSASAIYAILKLRELTPELKTSFVAGDMSAGHAVLLARLQPDDQRTLLKGIKDRESWEGEVSVRELEEMIHRDYFHELARAAFKKDDAELLPAAGPCTSCPKRTGAQPDVQTSAKDDACLDPACYNAKLDALVTLRKAQLEGRDVLQVREGYANGRAVKGALDPWEWRECKKKDPGAKQVLVTAGPGRGRLTWGKMTAQARQEQARESPQEKAKREKDAARQEEKRQVAEVLWERVLAAVLAAEAKARTRNKKLSLDILRLAVKVCYRQLVEEGYSSEEIEVFWGEELSDKEVEERIAALKEAELLSFVIKMALFDSLSWYGTTDRLEEAAAILRVDVKALEKEARAVIREKARQAKKKTVPEQGGPAEEAEKEDPKYLDILDRVDNGEEAAVEDEG